MQNNLKLGLLGNGIGRSSSPQLHIMLGQLVERETTYELMDLSENKGKVSIEDELKKCADAGYDGVNVTHPYKVAAYDCVEVEAHLPTGLHSINSVVFRDGKMRGDNTDFSGFCRGYENTLGDDFSPGRVLQLGAGGVGFALSFALKKLKAKEIVIFDKSKQAAQELIDLLKENGANARFISKELGEEMRDCDGLVNATPVGMYQYPGNPFPEEGFADQKWAFDAVYTPVDTEFLNMCRAHGLNTISGFQLFFFQGVNAFEYFSGRSVNSKDALQEYKTRFL